MKAKVPSGAWVPGLRDAYDPSMVGEHVSVLRVNTIFSIFMPPKHPVLGLNKCLLAMALPVDTADFLCIVLS